MKTALALLLLALPLFAADSTSKSEKEIATLTETWRQAVLKGDAAMLDRLYHHDLTYEHSTGKTENKAEAIASATKPGGMAKAVQFTSSTTRILGDTAIFKGIGDFTNFAGVTSHLDVLMVWIKNGSDWQLVARQSTKITP